MNKKWRVPLWKKISRAFSNWLFNRKMRRQRSSKGFCDLDVWDVDNWLTTVLPSIIEEHRAQLHTIPPAVEAFMCGENPWDFKYTSDLEVTEEQLEAWEHWWDDRLKKIVFHLREANYQTCSLKDEAQEGKQEYEQKVGQYCTRHFRKGMTMLMEVFGELND